MAQIIAIAGAKGGISKTTLTACLATYLQEQGNKVLCCDADPQLSLSTWAAVGAENGFAVPVTIAMGPQLRTQLPQLAEAYDYVLIDCPPSNDTTQRAAIVSADIVLLPCGPSTVEINASVASADLVRGARAVNPALQAFFVVTRVQPRTLLGEAVFERLGSLGIPVLDQRLSFRIDFQSVMDLGVGPTVFKPKSTAAKEVRDLVSELRGRLASSSENAHAA